MSEDAEGAILLAPVALQIFYHLGFILDALVGLEDEIVFACLIRGCRSETEAQTRKSTDQIPEASSTSLEKRIVYRRYY